jgi:membrane protein implicated in regulation of membrane protease activity
MEELVYWHWFVAGLGLLVLEMLLPTGFVLLWIGASAIVVGALSWLLPLGWPIQFMLFAVLCVVSFFLWKRYRPAELPTDRPTLNRRGASYVGRTFTLADPIVNGVGKLRVDDSQWRITGPDVPAGTQVQVVQADGATLHVEKKD